MEHRFFGNNRWLIRALAGAALALSIVQASLAIVSEMSTFEDAGVTDAGR